MRKITSLLTLLFFTSNMALSAGKIQNEDVKSFSEIKAAVLTTTGNLTSGNACITSPGSVAKLAVGQYIYDTTSSAKVASGTTIAGLPGICSAGQIQMSANATASATGDTLTFGGQGSQLINDTKIWMSSVTPAQQLSSAVTAGLIGGGGGGSGKNYLSDSSFEGFPASSVWTTTTASSATNISNFTDGSASATLTFSSQTGDIAQSVTPSTTLANVNMQASCFVNTSLATIQVCALVGGTETNCQNVPSTGNWTPVTSTFIGPAASTSVGVRVKTTASTSGTVLVDQCYVGKSLGMSEVAQAQFMGGITISGCNSDFSTSSTSFNNFGANTGCTYTPFSGALTPTAPATNLAGLKFTNLPPGEYLITFDGAFYNTTSNKTAYGQFGDGTNTAREISRVQMPITFGAIGTMTQSINYTTTQATAQIVLNGKTDSGGGAGIASSAGQQFTIKVYKVPTAVDAGYRPDQVPASWAGYHDNTCSWARTNASYGDPTADASCALVERLNRNFGTVSTSGSVLPAITFTPPRAGRYKVCANAKIAGATLGAVLDVRLWDGTTVVKESETTAFVSNNIMELPVCGIYNATNASTTLSLQTKATSGAVTIAANSTNTSALEWEIIELDAPMAAPYLNQSETNAGSGIVRHARARATCSNSAAALVSNDGGFTSASNGGSAGLCSLDYTALGCSAAPYSIQCTVIGAASTSAGHCMPTAAGSSTSVSLERTRAGAAENGDLYVSVECAK